MSGYTPEKPKPKYRVVYAGDGTYNVEKYGGLFSYITYGSRWYPVGIGLHKLYECDELVRKMKEKEETQTNNKGKIAKEYY